MKVIAPRLPQQLDEVVPGMLVAEAAYEACVLSGVVNAEGVATGVSLDECRIIKPLLNSARLPKVTFRDCIVDGGDCSAASMSDGGMQRVVWRDVRLTGLDCSNAHLKDIQFIQCKLDMANFRFAKLTNVLFEDCVLSEADFQNATLTNVRFRNSILHKTIFYSTTATKVDVRGSDIATLQGWQSAKGFIIDSVQLMNCAPQLAAALHIVIADD